LPVICEDTSLGFSALKGLPGPYIKWFLDKLGHDGLNKIIEAYEDKSATALCVFSYMKDSKSKAEIFKGETFGKIVPPRGPKDFGWDPVFEV
jgi:inosine triphosphate pyrophosphatase